MTIDRFGLGAQLILFVVIRVVVIMNAWDTIQYNYTFITTNYIIH